MNAGYTRILLLSLLLTSFCFSINAQIELKLQLMPDGESWGAYARPHPSINPSATTITASGQVTIVMPVDFEWNNLVDHSGKWVSNAAVASPPENVSAKYVSFGLIDDDPHITYIPGSETLLFTIKKVDDCPEFLYLIDCGTPNEADEFCFPNSLMTNPGNDMSVFDFSGGNASLYFFTDNYGEFAWSCHDSDGDGIVDAHEDTNGNGVFDPNEDASDLFDPNDPAGDGGLKLSLQLMPNGQSWGVFAKPSGGISPTVVTVTHEGRTEIVAPLGFEIDSITSHAGSWVHDTSVDGPQENQGRTYLGFTLMADDPPIPYNEGDETLLFTIHSSGACPDSLNIIDEETDPVALGCTPSQSNLCIFNTLNVTDYGTTPNTELYYTSSFSNAAWSCQDNDGDGIPNAFEDTNGDGIFNEDDDGSDLNDPCDPNHPLSANLTYEGETTLCAGDVLNAYLMVDVEGPLSSAYTVQFSDGIETFTVNNYQIGEEIPVAVFGGATYQLLYVADANACPVSGDLDGIIEIEKEGPISFTSQPVDVVACAGSAVYLEGLVENEGAGTVKYQWQKSCDNGVTWTDVTNGGVAEVNGSTTTKLAIDNLENDVSNCQFRLKAGTENCDAIYSDFAVLKSEGPLSIDAQPIDNQICVGDQACFTIEASNAGEGQVNYQWQAQLQGTADWFDLNDNIFISGSNTAQLCFNETTNVQGLNLRAVVKTAACGEVYSAFAVLELDGPLVVDADPVDLSVQQNEDAFFNANISNLAGGTANLQWEQSSDGVNWTDLADGDNGTNSIVGSNTTSLTISPANGLDGRQFRLVGSTVSCGELFTPAAHLTVNGQVLTVLSQPQDQTVCAGSFALFTVSVQNSSNEATSYQWEYTNNGIDWVEVPENIVYIGTETANLFVSDATGTDGYKFRCQITAGQFDPIISNSAKLEVAGPFGIETQAENAEVCFNEGHEFTVEIDNPSDLDYAIYWQMSDDDGDSWEAIENDSETGFGGIYEGTETENLNITSVEGLHGYQFRAIVDAGVCSTISDPVTLAVEDNPACYPSTDFVDYKLKLRPDGQSWGVWIKAVGDYTPSGYNKAISGRIVIAASAGFAYYDVKSQAAGTWLPGIYELNSPETPGISYYTFDLTAGNSNMTLTAGGEIMLFSFRKQGTCPAEIYLANEFVPVGLLPNEFSGIDLGLNPNVSFQLGEVYGADEADCNGGVNSFATNPNVGFELETASLSDDYKMTVYPNPAGDWINVKLLSQIDAEVVTYSVIATNGAKLVTTKSNRVQVADLPSGLYFIALELNGKIVSRQRFIKN